MSITIKTNNHRLPILDSSQIPMEVLKEFFDEDKINELMEGKDSASFFRYKGDYHNLADFLTMNKNEDFKGWDAVKSDTFFSGIVIKKVEEDHETYVIAGWYYS